MRKSMLLTSLATFCLGFFLFSQPVQAAGFVQDVAGVKYQNDDGSFLLDSWVQIGNGIYRLDANGLVVANCWMQIGNLWYQFDATGVCVNPQGSVTAPAQTAAPAIAAFPASSVQPVSSNNIFAAADWVPFATTNTDLLNAGVANGLVGFDGAQFWAEPTFAAQAAELQAVAPAVPAQTSGQQTVAPAPLPQSGELVWISGTGKKFHRRNNCGTMNPANARQVTRAEAEAQGKEACKKCY